MSTVAPKCSMRLLHALPAAENTALLLLVIIVACTTIGARRLFMHVVDCAVLWLAAIAVNTELKLSSVLSEIKHH
jgi:hypothetical protein